MTEIEEKNIIWQQISGADELREIYGYFPTLHDAEVKNIDIRFDSREIVFAVEYNDLVQKSGVSAEREDIATTRFQICWREVQKAQFKIYAVDLLGVSLRRIGDFIETRFRESPFGFDGYIVARNIEVIQIEHITEEENSSDKLRAIQISIDE